MGDNLDYYDTSDFPKDHPLHSQMNKKVLGKMKERASARALLSQKLSALDPRCTPYYWRTTKTLKKQRAQQKLSQKKRITHQNYKDALFKKTAFKHGMNMLRSKNHEIFEIHLNKTSISPFDSKRWIKEDGVHTLAYGHKDIGGN